MAGIAEETAIFVGAQGIKRVYLGETLIYQRPGSVLYLTLISE